jgi:hypothetical protein
MMFRANSTFSTQKKLNRQNNTGNLGPDAADEKAKANKNPGISDAL